VVASARGVAGVASTIPYATLAGVRVLEEGGNAFDAAVATSAVLAALLPQTGDLGGDAFLLARLENGEVLAYNGSGRSPRKFDARAFIEKSPKRGPLTVTVPGLADVWGWVAEELCTKDLGELLKPAVSLLRNGFYPQDMLLASIERERREVQEFESWARTFGRISPGALVKFPVKAWVFEELAKKGAREFYEGAVAEKVVEELSSQGVPVEKSDFEKHRGERVKPLKALVEGFELYELPPNTQGHTTLQVLKTYEALDEVKRRPWDDAARISAFFDVAVAAYKYRDENLGDPKYMAKGEADLLRELVLSAAPAGGSSALHAEDTTFFVVADSRGNCVGFIQSIFHHFGSGIVACEIPFQNRGAGFAKKLGLPNSPAPEKRPLHTLSVLLAEKEGEVYIVGCAGGDLRPQIHANVFINIAYYGRSLQQAVELPRYVVLEWEGYKPVRAVVEKGIDSVPRRAASVERPLPSPSTGIVHALHKTKGGEVVLVADPRGTGASYALW